MQKAAYPLANEYGRNLPSLSGLWPGLAVMLGCCPAATVVTAASGPSDLCLHAARDAAAINDVPLSVMVAITQTETGRLQDGETRPWPWTVNLEGEGHWFPDRAAALSFASEQFDLGKRSFDIGCFQINFRWHSENFVSLDQMFDPLANATYAAQFLVRLKAETGDWSAAAGAYHSRTEALAQVYRARFESFRDAIEAQEPSEISGFLGSPEPGPEFVRVEGANEGLARPLLSPINAPRTPGSLVPLTSGG
jgi:hypothetical protein